MQLFKRVILGVLLSFGALLAADQKAVFDLTSGDAAVIEKHLVRNIEALADYYRANQITFKLVVVISGDAYKYFVEDIENSPYSGEPGLKEAQKKLAPRLERLHREHGVEFDMCKAGMKARKIGRELLYGYVRSDLNKSVYLIQWQNKGYAYMPVH